MTGAKVGLAYGWPFIFLVGALGVFIWLGDTPPSDRAFLLSVLGCLLAVPAQAWHLSRRVLAPLPGGLRGLVALLLPLAASAVAMLLFVYALFWTGLYGE